MKVTKKFTLMFAVLTFVLSLMVGTAFAEDDVVLDFDNMFIYATGVGIGPKNREHNSSFYKLYARQTAWLNALSLGAKELRDISISGDTAIKDIIIPNKPLSRRFRIIFENIHQVGETKFFEDGHCEITVAIPIFSVKSTNINQ